MPKPLVADDPPEDLATVAVRQTGAALIMVLQASPHRDVDLEPERMRLPVDDAEDLS
jgi:hypothetical protein